MKNNQITANALQVLEENLREYNSNDVEKMTLLQYYQYCAQNAPGHFQWLFNNAENIGDYGTGMTDDQCEAASNFEREIVEAQKSIQVGYKITD